MIKDRPSRLDLIFIEQPLYFVTFATWNRQIIPSLELAKSAVEKYAQRALQDFNIGVGRYVVMPDHIHLFVRGDGNFSLSQWIAGLKRAISNAFKVRGTFWQPGFFDHILRSDESYSEKWNYVRENPVRAGLVKDAGDWRFQGEIVLIDRA
jgi:REP-associated tyrosine transposase